MIRIFIALLFFGLGFSIGVFSTYPFRSYDEEQAMTRHEQAMIEDSAYRYWIGHHEVRIRVKMEMNKK